VTEAEVRELLEFARSWDETLDPEASLATWADSLGNPWVPNLSLDEAMAAVFEHYRCTPVRVTPAGILGRVRDDRAGHVTALGVPRCGVPPNEEYRAARAGLEAMLEARRAER
jgi:hypothetical protein